MDIYTRKSRWKLYLTIGGAVILLISLFYTRYLSQMLAEGERTKVENWVLAQQQLNDPERLNDPARMDEDVTLQLEVLKSNTTIPVVMVNERGDIIYATNFGPGLDENTQYLKKQVEDLKKKGFEPIFSSGNYIYYKESKVLQQLRYFPLVQLVLIVAFIGLGYLGFSAARRAEQNRVWVGMAKETAHQLGTPISAIIGWIEHLKITLPDNSESEEIIEELRKDVNRLELVAERFSKIGSAPVLEPINIIEELDKCRAYMQARAPRKVAFHFPPPDADPVYVNLNPHLFDWVLENLMRNSIDAMEGKGSIAVEVHTDNGNVLVDVSDTGKGIPHSKFKTVFEPGYTTKKRGWGLGLSLAKRIIEEYHSGKIFVKRSEENKGTTFTLKFARAKAPATSLPALAATKV